MSDMVAVVGEGLLSDFVCREISDRCEVVRQSGFEEKLAKAAKLVLVLHDHWRAADYLSAEEALQRCGVPWLSGFVAYGEGVVGPLVRPGTPGCSQCAEMRRVRAGHDSGQLLEQQMRRLIGGETPREAAVSPMVLLQMACLIAAEVRKALQEERTLLEGRVYLIDSKTLTSSLHAFLPDPLCQVCGEVPDDSYELARISLRPCPKISADTYRCRPTDDLKEVVNNTYFDRRTGLVNDKMADLRSPFADVIVNLPSLMGNVQAFGHSHVYVESEMAAMLEGLERYCGMAPRGKRTVIREKYRNLADRALDPVSVGVYSQEQYALPDFPLEPFDPDRPIAWVWGYSFLQQRPILVPESLAYYNLGDGFVIEASNGCALGGSLEEAILFGILEVVERDSFLMTWYAQLPVPRLDPQSAGDKELRLMIDRLQAVAGYDVHLFNSTMENGIPSVCAIAKNRKTKGPNLACSAAAHLDPLRAAKSAIHELAGVVHMLDEEFERNREEYVRMYEDPSLVMQMEDHSRLYSVPQAEERLSFLLDENRPLRTFDDEFKRMARHADLTEDLKNVLERFRRLGLDVIVVDQTAPEILRSGLHCVKVLIPGMLPMTFGHHLTRLTGLERILRIPMELGYAKQWLTLEQLNPHPHPFA